MIQFTNVISKKGCWKFPCEMENAQQKDLSHHKRLEYCTSRLKYRDGRKLTAIKVNLDK